MSKSSWLDKSPLVVRGQHACNCCDPHPQRSAVILAQSFPAGFMFISGLVPAEEHFLIRLVNDGSLAFGKKRRETRRRHVTKSLWSASVSSM